MSSPFERSEAAFYQWDGQGDPPARPIYLNPGRGVSALVDPYSGLRHAAVVYLHPSKPGTEDHLADRTYTEVAMLGHVVHAIGVKLLDASRRSPELQVVTTDHGTQRVLERVDGFNVPVQAHIRMGLGYRGENAEEQGSIPTSKQIDKTWHMLRLRGYEKADLDHILSVQALMAPFIDGNRPISSLERFADMAGYLGFEVD